MIQFEAIHRSVLKLSGSAALPALLAMAIVFGGALRGAELLATLMQVVACAVLLWLVNLSHGPRVNAPAWVLFGIVASFIAVAILQLVHLPPDYWTQINGRDPIAEAFRLSDTLHSWMPISMAPHSTFSALFHFLPPVAVFFLVTRSRWQSISACADWVIPIAAAASSMLGLFQILFPEIPFLFPQGRAASGQAQGLLQVVNHNATLMLMAIPFLASAVSRIKTRFELGDPDVARAIFAALLLILITAGIAATGSVAAYILAVPVFLLSALIIVGGRRLMPSMPGGLFLMLGLVVLIVFVTTSPATAALGLTDLSDSPLARRTVYANTYLAVRDHFPFGSGLGSFVSIYPMYEDPSLVTAAFIDHAHNEYLEIALELGLPGILILLVGLAWIAARSFSAWRASDIAGRRIRCAASIACFVVVTHCLVEAPIRSQSIACLFAYCLAVLSMSPSSRIAGIEIDPSTARHRHLAI